MSMMFTINVITVISIIGILVLLLNTNNVFCDAAKSVK